MKLCKGCGSAFTLIEILVVLFITVLLFASVHSVLSSAFDSRTKYEAHFEMNNRITQAVSLLTDDLEQTVFKDDTADFRGKNGESRGLHADTMLFRTTSSVFTPGNRSAYISDVGYFLEEYKDTDGQLVETALELRRTTVPFRRISTADNGPPPPEPSFGDTDEDETNLGILRGVTRFNIHYFNGNLWQDNWQSTAAKRIPDAVYIEISIRPESVIRSDQSDQISAEEITYRQYITLQQGSLEDGDELVQEE